MTEPLSKRIRSVADRKSGTFEAQFLHAWASEVAALEEECLSLAEALAWTRQELSDALPLGEGEDASYIPDHPCEFTLAPDSGRCRFHEKWFEGLEALATHNKRRSQT